MTNDWGNTPYPPPPATGPQDQHPTQPGAHASGNWGAPYAPPPPPGDQRPWFKKKRYWAGGVAALVLLGAVSGGGETTDTTAADASDAPSQDAAAAPQEGSQQPKKNKAEKEEAAAPEQQQAASEPAPEVLVASAADMLAAYDGNEAAADAMYDGRTIDVTGSVDEVDTELFNSDEYVVRMGDGSEFSFLTVNCNDISPEQAASVQPGSTVTVRGVFDDGGDLGVELSDCEVR